MPLKRGKIRAKKKALTVSPPFNPPSLLPCLLLQRSISEMWELSASFISGGRPEATPCDWLDVQIQLLSLFLYRWHLLPNFESCSCYIVSLQSARLQLQSRICSYNHRSAATIKDLQLQSRIFNYNYGSAAATTDLQPQARIWSYKHGSVATNTDL